MAEGTAAGVVGVVAAVGWLANSTAAKGSIEIIICVSGFLTYQQVYFESQQEAGLLLDSSIESSRIAKCLRI